MNEMQIFNNEQFGQVRVVEHEGEPWFVLKDVCAVFGEINYRRVAERIDDDEKGVSQIDTPGGKQNMSIINEFGVYAALFAMQPTKARNVSDEYIAKRQRQLKDFKRWVTHEVIPSIRKHGAYATPATIDNIIANPDFGIKLLLELKEEREKTAALEAKVEEAAPKVLFADSVAASSQSILIGELAKILRQNGIEVGQNRLFERLRKEGFLGTHGEYYNIPTQRAMEMKLFEIKKRAITSPDGRNIVSTTVKVTGNGQQYFVNRYLTKQAK